jgi:hypothetical protein
VSSVEPRAALASRRADVRDASLEISEIIRMFELGDWSMAPGYRRAIFLHAIREALRRSGVIAPSGTVAEILPDRQRPLGAARPDINEAWPEMYPAPYRRLVAIHGVPTAAYTAGDVFNRTLVELLPPDCDDRHAIEDAQAVALCRALGLDLKQGKRGRPG